MIKFLKLFGTGTSIAGSFLVAYGFYRFGYSCFFSGAIAWLYVAWRIRESELFVLNCFFGAANVIGLYRAFA